MLDQHHYWIEFSRLVDAFRRVGKLGGKASLTASTEDGLWRAGLEIQTRLVSAAKPGPASPPTAQPAAPSWFGAAEGGVGVLAGPSWAADDGLVWISKLAFQSPFSVEVVSEAFPPSFPTRRKASTRRDSSFQ